MAKIDYNRNDTITFTVSEREKDLICQKANDKGLTMSAFCRLVLLGEDVEKGAIKKDVH